MANRVPKYDRLTRGWRVAYGIAGGILVVVGAVGTAGEVTLARRGYPLAWVAAVLAAGLTVLGAYLLVATRAGRIRSLGLGAPRDGTDG